MMKSYWFAGDFCPREATCSLEDGALTPSNGPKIRTLVMSTPHEQTFTATVQVFKNESDFSKAGTQAEDWVKCEGQFLSISQFVPLFSLIGTQYGGDGRTIFGLPNLHNEPDGPYYIYTLEDFGHGR